MIQQDPNLSGALVWTPGELQAEARSVNVDMVATNASVGAGVSEDLFAGWTAFYNAWREYFVPIDESWTWNIITGAAAWANIDQIRDWRARLITWQKALRADGADVPVSAEQSSAGPPTLGEGAASLFGMVKWVAIVGLGYVVTTKIVLPAIEAKRKVTGRKS